MPQKILKSSNGHMTAVFVVMEPGVEDRNGDVVEVAAITEAAHEFMDGLASKSVNLNHQPGTDIDKTEARFVESFILPADLEGETPDGKAFTVKAGSWLVAIKFSEALWKKVEAGEFSGVSME